MMLTENITAISERKLAANRANAQRSTGPRTEAGKERSRMNRLIHGLAATIACIPGEDPAEFAAKRQAYAQFFEPTTQVELDLVNDLVLARWRLDRYARYEGSLLHATIEKHRHEFDAEFPVLSDDVKAALAFKLLVDQSKSLDSLKRYEGSIRSGFNAAWRQLAALKKGEPPIPVPLPEPGDDPTEPTVPVEPNEPTAVEPNEPTERNEPTEPLNPAAPSAAPDNKDRQENQTDPPKISATSGRPG